MQVPITLQKQIFPIAVTKEFRGSLVPFEIKSYKEDFENSKKGGFFDLSDWGVVEISGPDAADYLQRMSTVNMKKLAQDELVDGAFLTGRGTVVLLGSFIKKSEDRFWFCVSPQQIERALEHLEQFHFQEKLEIKNLTSELAVVGVWKDGYGQEIVPRSELETTLKKWNQGGLSFLGMHLYHFFRIQRGTPWLGWEVGDSDLILEASMERAVARNKGCYPGQEVVERIFTYGQVNRKLMRVVCELPVLGQLPETPQEVRDGESVVGKLMSVVQDPEDDRRAWGLAYIKKGFWEKTEPFFLNSGNPIRIC